MQLQAAQVQSTQQLGIFRNADEEDSEVGEDAEEALEMAEQAGPGQPLPADLKAPLENSMKADLSGVRVHTGEQSARAASAAGANAFAKNQDIHFGEGKYQPGSQDGKRLIAHEVAHTAAHAGNAPASGGVSQAGDGAEHAADHAADRFMEGKSAPVGRASSSAAIHADKKGKKSPKKKKQEELPDWEVGPGPQKKSDEAYEAVVMTRPEEDAGSITMGETHRQHYEVTSQKTAPDGTKYDWFYTMTGGSQDEFLTNTYVHGEDHDVELSPKAPGKHTIKGKGMQHSKKGKKKPFEIPSVTFKTPKSEPGHPLFDSINPAKNRRPVHDMFGLGEDLLVTVELSNITDNVDNVKVVLGDAHGLQVEGTHNKAKKVGPRTFQAQLATTGDAAKKGAGGQLYFLPLNSSKADSKPIPFNKKVEANTFGEDGKNDPNAPGSRPKDLSEGLDALKANYDHMFQRRHDAVSNFFDQEKIEDPPAKPPLWKVLGKKLVKMALDKVSGGLISAMTDFLEEDEGKSKIAGLLTAGADALIDGAIGKIFDGGQVDTSSWKDTAEKDLPKQPVKMDMAIAFRDANWQGLAEHKKAAVTSGISNTRHVAQGMEQKKAGSGFRFVMDLVRGASASADRAHTDQFQKTLSSWLTMMAGNSKSNGELLKGDGKSVNLGTMVNKDNVTRHQVGTIQGTQDGSMMEGEPIYSIPGGVPKVAGILRISLKEDKHSGSWDVDSQYGKHTYRKFDIDEAQISGLKNQAMRDNLGIGALRDLQIPMVFSFARNHKDEGFMIGRNENGQVWADEQGTLLKEGVSTRAKKSMSTLEAATYVIDKEVGWQHVKPKG